MRRVAPCSLMLAVLLCSCSGGTSSVDTNKNSAAAPAPKGPNTPPIGWLGEVNGTPKVGGTIAVNGWAADEQDGAPVQKIEVTIDDRVVALAGPINLARTDVVQVTHRPDFLNSGWGADVRLTGVFPGKHRIAAVAYDSQGAKAELQGAREIEVLAGQ
jgi:hypothetical protein